MTALTDLYDPRDYLALIGRIRGCHTRAALEATIPEVCAFANGTLRHELARTWFATWTHLFPATAPDLTLWPPEK